MRTLITVAVLLFASPVLAQGWDRQGGVRASLTWCNLGGDCTSTHIFRDDAPKGEEPVTYVSVFVYNIFFGPSFYAVGPNAVIPNSAFVIARDLQSATLDIPEALVAWTATGNWQQSDGTLTRLADEVRYRLRHQQTSNEAEAVGVIGALPVDTVTTHGTVAETYTSRDVTLVRWSLAEK